MSVLGSDGCRRNKVAWWPTTWFQVHGGSVWLWLMRALRVSLCLVWACPGSDFADAVSVAGWGSPPVNAERG